MENRHGQVMTGRLHKNTNCLQQMDRMPRTSNQTLEIRDYLKYYFIKEKWSGQIQRQINAYDGHGDTKLSFFYLLSLPDYCRKFVEICILCTSLN